MKTQLTRDNSRTITQELENPQKHLNLAFLLIGIIPVLALLVLICNRRWAAHDVLLTLIFAGILMALGYLTGYKIVRHILNKVIASAAKAKHADELKSSFAMSLAHDLKSPLSVIKANLSNLRTGFVGELNSQQEKIVLSCKETADRMNAILTNLINTYKIEAGMVELNIIRFDLRELLEEQVRELSPLAAAKKILFAIEPCRDPLPVQGDRNMLVRAINNIISNAIKYTPETGKVSVRSQPSDGFAMVECSNSGATIPKEKLLKIFDKFERLDAASEGHGLGLAIAKDIVELHHGRIWAASEPGTPNRFVFLLNLAEKNAS